MARLRILIKMGSADAFELKAQALNNDPRLLSAGISALKFAQDKNYIAGGEFSPDLPPQTAPEQAPVKPESDSKIGKRLRVVLRMVSDDAFELKSQALNEDSRLKDAGITALKFVGDKQYISDGEFSPELPSQPQPDLAKGKKLRIRLRLLRQDAYELTAKHLNGDPELIKAGITGIDLVKGAGIPPIAEITLQEGPPVPQPVSTPVKKRNRSLVGYLLAALILIGFGIVAIGASLVLPGFFAPSATSTPTATMIEPVTVLPTSTATSIPATPTRIPPTRTEIPSTKTPTATKTPSPTPQIILSCRPPELGTIIAENLSCRYGPGANYLYRYGLGQKNQVQILGRADTAYGTWVYVQTQTEDNIKCWINADPKYVEVEGDVACLESYYPDKAPLIIFPTDLFPAPTNVDAGRSGSQVFISWTGYELAPGDRESESSPRYLLELWTCQDGKIVFTPMGVFDEFAAVIDEGGCSEPSHGQVFLAHKDGYIGPSYIPWPP